MESVIARVRTPQQYLDGLRDGREVYYRGERVPDVVDHPELGIAAQHGSLDFVLSEDPKYRELALTDGYSSFYHVPRNAADIRRRSSLIETSTRLGGTLVVLLKEIGTDALFALQRVTHGTKEYERVLAFHDQCRSGDLALALAQTDVKGDRSRGPSAQNDPDLYVHIVDRNGAGIVVRGAKAHTSCTPNVDEVIVIPTRALGDDEQDWAVAFVA